MGNVISFPRLKHTQLPQKLVVLTLHAVPGRYMEPMRKRDFQGLMETLSQIRQELCSKLSSL